MPELRRFVFTIRAVTDGGTVVKSGTTVEELEDALWDLYEREILPFAPDEDDLDDLDDEDDAGIELDEEYDDLEPPADTPAPPTKEA